MGNSRSASFLCSPWRGLEAESLRTGRGEASLVPVAPIIYLASGTCILLLSFFNGRTNVPGILSVLPVCGVRLFQRKISNQPPGSRAVGSVPWPSSASPSMRPSSTRRVNWSGAGSGAPRRKPRSRRRDTCCRECGRCRQGPTAKPHVRRRLLEALRELDHHPVLPSGPTSVPRQ